MLYAHNKMTLRTAISYQTKYINTKYITSNNKIQIYY